MTMTILRRVLPTALTLTLVCAGSSSAQTVHGEVTDAETGNPIEGVRLRLLDLSGEVVAATDSEDDGSFQLRARDGGLYSVAAQRLGYTSYRSDAVSVEDAGDIEVRVRMGVDAIPLSPFVVLADSQIRRGRVADFERRRDDPSLGGHFLDAEDVRARPTATPTQLLRALPSVELYQIQTEDNRRGLDRSLIYLPGSRGLSLIRGKCLAQVFINGIAARQSQDGHNSIDDVLDGVPIVGVEVYSRAAAAPPGFQGTGECGVVMYWTEEPTGSTRGWGIKRIVVGVGAIAGVLLFGFSR